GDDAVRAMLGACLDGDTPPEVEELVRRYSSGYPLLIEEMLADLQASGGIVRTDGQWITGGTLDTVRVPRSYARSVAVRLEAVSATGREAAGSLVPGRAMGFRTFLQTDARIHRGNSGGPVLDTAGQVVGVAVATGDRVGEISFAIPIDRVREVIDALRDDGQVTRGWLGVLVKPVTAELAQSLGLPKPTGALVTEVKAGSPAARAGLRTGDVVLTWAGRDVDHQSLPWIVAATPINKPNNVVVWRTRASIVVPIVTEKMPE
ncbi:MAG: PDZ domain-containing protein, partial [Proteobacteria bacterium]|nr:PDZ domain-containing protein [Pseudomonadota bacterium]